MSVSQKKREENQKKRVLCRQYLSEMSYDCQADDTSCEASCGALTEPQEMRLFNKKPNQLTV